MPTKRNLHKSTNSSLGRHARTTSRTTYSAGSQLRSNQQSTFSSGLSGTNTSSSRTHTGASSNIGNTRSVHGSAATDSSPGNVRVGDVVISRRTLIYGAIGAGVVAAGAFGVSKFIGSSSNDEESDILSVSEDAVTASTDLTEIENPGGVYLLAYLQLPYGTLIWNNDDEYAALLLPTETGAPLTQVGLLRLSSGYYFTIMTQAIGASDGFEIYDVRAISNGMIWTEVDIMEGIWRIYTAPLNDGTMGDALLVDEGDSEWETPTIAIAGKRAFWQVLPSTTGTKTSEASVVKSTLIGSSDVTEVYTSYGRMCSPIYALDSSIVITPRKDTSSVHHQLTLIDANTLETLDTLTLPTSMKPLEAGYGKTGFMFSFEGIYSYGDGIANLGTYIPKEDTRNGNYSAAQWFRFARTPSAAPCWCGDLLVVKSSRSNCCIDLNNDTYFLLEAMDNSESYGDYLASTGNRKRFVTYANVTDTSSDGSEESYCYVRVWADPDA